MNTLFGIWYSYCIVADTKELIVSAVTPLQEREDRIKKIGLNAIKVVASVTWAMCFLREISVFSFPSKIQHISLSAFFLFYGEMCCQSWERAYGNDLLPKIGYAILIAWSFLALGQLYFSSIVFPFSVSKVYYAGTAILYLQKIEL